MDRVRRILGKWLPHELSVVVTEYTGGPDLYLTSSSYCATIDSGWTGSCYLHGAHENHKCMFLFRDIVWGHDAEYYTGTMRLSSDPLFRLPEDKCAMKCADRSPCDLLNLSCGCAFHKECIRYELVMNIDACPGCGPVRPYTLAKFDSYLAAVLGVPSINTRRLFLPQRVQRDRQLIRDRARIARARRRMRKSPFIVW